MKTYKSLPCKDRKATVLASTYPVIIWRPIELESCSNPLKSRAFLRVSFKKIDHFCV